MDKWQKCPLIENCQQKSAVCNVQLPDETCYWFRWFRALDNPWHTGTPTGKGYYLIKYQCQIGKLKGNITYRAVKRYKDDLYDGFVYEDGGIGADDIWKPIEWQKIEEKEDGREETETSRH